MIGWLVFLVILFGHRELGIDLVMDPLVLMALFGVGVGAYAYSSRPYARLVTFVGGLALGFWGFVAIWISLFASLMLVCAVIALGSGVLGIVAFRRK